MFWLCVMLLTMAAGAAIVDCKASSHHSAGLTPDRTDPGLIACKEYFGEGRDKLVITLAWQVLQDNRDYDKDPTPHRCADISPSSGLRPDCFVAGASAGASEESRCISYAAWSK